tara:strand:+ start:480 stop:1181 length:702 start_codon:yes stop_codon:yes gene_type:complete
MINYYIMTIFPDLISSFINHSIIAKSKKNINFEIIDIRTFSDKPHFKTDDIPYGGGSGMIFKPEPVFRAFDYLLENRDLSKNNLEFIFPSPDGKVFKHNDALNLSKKENIIFLCGHYKGIDQRIRDELVDAEYSIGDYVLTGGELPCCIIIDSIVRLVPGVLKNYDSAMTDSFYCDLLDNPHYTRPREYRGFKVPEILFSGNHRKIEKWKLEARKKKTKEIRPEIWEKIKNNY